MAVVLSDDDRKAYLKEKGASDLLYVFTDSQVPLVQQYDLVMKGYATLRLFSGLEDTRAEMRTALKDEMGLDPATAGNRIIIAAIINAWEVSREQLSSEVKLRAEAKALNIQRPVGTLERAQMKKIVMDKVGKFPSSETPSADYLASKMEEVEVDEPMAGPLDEVISQDAAEASSLSANTAIQAMGSVHLVRKKIKILPPQGPEEFRLRMRTECYLHMMLAAKFTNRPWLQGIDQVQWGHYVDHFLGRKCHTLQVPGDSGALESLNPSWAIVLNYEHACRREAFRMVRDGEHTLAEAMLLVVKDAELKEISFTSPIALGSRKRAWAEIPRVDGKDGKGKGKTKKQRQAAAKAAAAAALPPPPPSGEGRGARKGKGKGKGKLDRMTPDGRQLCYAYSSPEGCQVPDCPRVHLCRVPGCLGDHPTQDHPGS
jgi:hypothetical protein